MKKSNLASNPKLKTTKVSLTNFLQSLISDLLSKMDEDQITSFNQEVLGEYHHEQPIKKGPQVSKMTLGYMNKVFGETQDKEKVRNDFYVIEKRQKKEKFLDEDELVHMV